MEKRIVKPNEKGEATKEKVSTPPADSCQAGRRGGVLLGTTLEEQKQWEVPRGGGGGDAGPRVSPHLLRAGGPVVWQKRRMEGRGPGRDASRNVEWQDTPKEKRLPTRPFHCG